MKRALFVVVAVCSLCPLVPSSGHGQDPDERKRPRKAISFDCEMSMGVTPGGAQDVGFFRDRVRDGEIPHPEVFTPEGLFSEHDLPLADNASCDALICPAGEAMNGSLLAQPEVRYLAQLGFSSGISAKDFERAPLNLVAVIDKSGSMSGQPLELVKQSLSAALDFMGPKDQLAIVLYGDRSHVFLEPTRVEHKDELRKSIAAIESAGSTNMEEGLVVGFELARKSAKRFDGSSRVMLFTDERPNVGRTDAAGFMSLAEQASKDGIGMTTIGVGVQFGAELAQTISAVRGGNLFFFSNVADMQRVFESDFDTMVTELAYDMKLHIKAASGLRLAGVYGIPGSALRWTDDGAIEVGVATLFLSRRKGAIYVAMASAEQASLPSSGLQSGQSVGSIQMTYTLRDKSTVQQSVELTLRDQVSLGLSRGLLLVNEATALRAAASSHHVDNNQEAAYQMVRALAVLLRADTDSELDKERELVFQLENTLALLSGHQGETHSRTNSALDLITGLPPR